MLNLTNQLPINKDQSEEEETEIVKKQKLKNSLNNKLNIKDMKWNQNKINRNKNKIRKNKNKIKTFHLEEIKEEGAEEIGKDKSKKIQKYKRRIMKS